MEFLNGSRLDLAHPMIIRLVHISVDKVLWYVSSQSAVRPSYN